MKGIEVGVYDKVYDQSDGKYYWERKIIKVPIGGIVQFDWIAQRVAEDELAEAIEQAEEQPSEIKEEEFDEAEEQRKLSKINVNFRQFRDKEKEDEKEDEPPI